MVNRTPGRGSSFWGVKNSGVVGFLIVNSKPDIFFLGIQKQHSLGKKNFLRSIFV